MIPGGNFSRHTYLEMLAAGWNFELGIVSRVYPPFGLAGIRNLVYRFGIAFPIDDDAEEIFTIDEIREQLEFTYRMIL